MLGDAAELPAVAALAELPESEVAPAVALLSRAEVLRDDYPLGFVHPLVRDAVYRDLPPGEREMAHQRAARELEATRAPREQVAAHLLQVPRRGDAVDGRGAARRGRHRGQARRAGGCGQLSHPRARASRRHPRYARTCWPSWAAWR